MGLDTANEIAGALADRVERNKLPKAKKQAKKPKAQKIKTHRPRKESTKTITNRLYSLWSLICRHIYGNKCAVTGETGVLDAHHIIPRQICSGLRFDPMNSILLSKSAHKFGKKSAHKNGIWFADWLMKNYPDRYAYCLAHMDDELDCKDRATLYRVEVVLHREYEAVIGRLPVYTVTAILKDGRIDEYHVSANNPKMAEFEMTTRYPVKGIVSVKKV